MSSRATHQVRRIARLSVETPLLAPSFSSRGFPDIGAIIDALRVDVGGLCLVSAFDLAHEHAPPDFEALADIVVIDSGLYEASPAAVAVDAYLPTASNRAWTRDAYRAFLVAAAPRMSTTNTIVVSYDSYAPLNEQVEHARADFANASGAAFDFLLKPEVEGQIHGPWAVTGSHLAGFDIIGVTERELGRSALARCRALLSLRAALSTAGLDTPIHVFGSITPAAVTAYFLCGADIFDGLNWLRVGFDDAWAGALSEFAVAHGLGTFDDTAVQLELWRRNLRALQRTQGALKRFALGGDRGVLGATLPFAEAALALAVAAGRAEGE